MALQKQTILKIGIIGMALLVILVVVIVVRNMSAVKKTAITADQSERVMKIVNSALITCAEDPYPEVCRQRHVSKQARENKSSEVCEVLEGEERVTCVYSVLRETLDVNDCKVLDGAEHDSCRDHVIRLTAQESLNLALCSGIGDQNEREDCTRIVTSLVIASGRCAELGVDPRICDVNGIIQKAVRELNQDVCNDLQGDDNERCLGEVKVAQKEAREKEYDEPIEEQPIDASLDSDFDGLTDQDEINIHKTDPNNPDSDNDGFDDKTEIDGGYNPNGR